MRRLTLIGLIALAAAATGSAQTMRDYTVSWPAVSEADMLAAYAAVYPQTWATTLADGSSARLTYGLTVCVPASATDHQDGVCAVRDTTAPERRTILRRQLRAYMREMYRARLASAAAEAARAQALAAADAAVATEQ